MPILGKNILTISDTVGKSPEIFANLQMIFSISVGPVSVNVLNHDNLEGCG